MIETKYDPTQPKVSGADVIYRPGGAPIHPLARGQHRVPDDKQLEVLEESGMTDLPPELAELSKTLKQVFVMHIRGRESVISYRITDAAGKVVGHKTVVTVNKTGKVTVGYALGDERFERVEPFLKAYQQTLRDAEWDASAPKGVQL